MHLEVALHVCLRQLSTEKLTLGDGQVCIPEEGNSKRASVCGVIVNPNTFPGSRIR